MKERHLELANKHIILTQKNIAEQEARILLLGANGYDTIRAETKLAGLQQRLATLYARRDHILAALNK